VGNLAIGAALDTGTTLGLQSLPWLLLLSLGLASAASVRLWIQADEIHTSGVLALRTWRKQEAKQRHLSPDPGNFSVNL
jgi:hypothetical protein